MFQTLSDIESPSLKETTLIAYEPGSVILRNTFIKPLVIPGVIFRKLALPDIRDLNSYFRRCTV